MVCGEMDCVMILSPIIDELKRRIVAKEKLRLGNPA